MKKLNICAIIFIYEICFISSSSSSATTDSSHSSSGSSHPDVQPPLVPNEENGGFNLTEYVFPSNFTCMNVTNPQSPEDCLHLNMTSLSLSCCFVMNKLKGVSTNNTCVALNTSNLPAYQFLVYNTTYEIESEYECSTLKNRFSLSLLSFIIILILVNNI